MVGRRKTTRRTTTRRTATNSISPTMIKVGIMGRETTEIMIDKQMTVRELLNQLGINARQVQGSKTLTGNNFRDLNDNDVVNGYKAIVCVPSVEGG